MRNILTTTIILLVLATGCKSKKKATETTTEEETTTEAPDKLYSASDISGTRNDVLVIDPKFTAADKDNGTFTIESAEIQGDQIVMIVSYSGGCENHDFRLLFNGNYMKSMPPKAELFLLHDAHGDACRSLIKEEIKVDISQLKENNSEVTIILDAFKGQLSY